MDASVDRHVSAPTRWRQWTLIALLVAAGVVNYLDRSSLAIAAGEIKSEMHLSFSEVGLLLSAFALAYAVAQIPVGIITDKVGPRIMLAGGMTLWSLAQIACGGVQNFGQFIIGRIGLGLGETPMFTAGARATVNWFPVRERGVPLGLFNAASSLGPALAPPLLTWLMLAYGWRWMFVLMGLLGLAVAALWFLWYREPEQVGTPASDIAAIHAEEVQAELAKGPDFWSEFIARPTTWALMGGLFGIVYVTWLCVSWLPYYLETVHHVSKAQTGWLAAIPQVAGFVGGVLGGFVSDGLARRGMEPVLSRKIPTIGALVIAAVFAALAPLASQTWLALTFFSVSMFFGYASGACAWALGATLTPPHLVATLEAVQNIGGSLGGFVAPALTGIIVDKTGSFVPAFLIGAVAALLSAGSYALVRADDYEGLGTRTARRLKV